MPTEHPYSSPNYLDTPKNGTLHDMYYNNAYYFAVGRGNGQLPADGFAEHYCKVIAERAAAGNYQWSMTDEYNTWEATQ